MNRRPCCLLLVCAMFSGCDASRTDDIIVAGKANRIVTEDHEIGAMPRSQQSRNADCSAIPDDPRLVRVADELATLFRPSIRLLTEPGTVQLPAGATRLGGRPDLPPDTPWPTCHIDMPAPSDAFLKARPRERRVPEDGIVHLAFVGQINLQDVNKFDTESLLPSSGMLSFFYNPQTFASDWLSSGSGQSTWFQLQRIWLR